MGCPLDLGVWSVELHQHAPDWTKVPVRVYDTETVPIIPTSVPSNATLRVHLHVTSFSRSYCCRTAPQLPCEFWEMYVHRSVRVNTISFFLEYKIMLTTGCHTRLTAFTGRANVVRKAYIPHRTCHRHMHTLYRIC